ncbi:MAG: hypothetical protein ABWY49_12820 [Rhizobium sp.]
MNRLNPTGSLVLPAATALVFGGTTWGWPGVATGPPAGIGGWTATGGGAGAAGVGEAGVAGSNPGAG